MSATTMTTEELMVHAASLEIRDNEVGLIGTGLPMIASYLAKATHAPGTALVFESGVMDNRPRHMPSGVGDFPLIHGAVKTGGLFEALGLLQGGHIDIGFLGAAEVDRYGNINSTAIGPYDRPDVRLSGSGGANDIASLAGRTVVIARHKRRTFPERVGYLTTPGFLGGPGERERHGLRGRGPVTVITDMCVFGFDDATKRMRLRSLHPGVAQEQVRAATGFDIGAADTDAIARTPVPSAATLRTIRALDPDGVYIGAR